MHSDCLAMVLVAALVAGCSDDNLPADGGPPDQLAADRGTDLPDAAPPDQRGDRPREVQPPDRALEGPTSDKAVVDVAPLDQAAKDLPGPDLAQADAAPPDAGLSCAGNKPTVCNAAGWCWDNPRPVGYGLLSLSGTGPKNALAVGEDGIVLRHDGTGWTFLGLVDVKGNELHDVWAAASGEIFVVGAMGTIARHAAGAWAP